MIHAHGKLIGNRRHLGGCGIGSSSERAVGGIRQRISREHSSHSRTYRDRQGIAGKSAGIDSLPLGRGWHRKNLSCSQHLPETLVLTKVESLVATVVEAGQDDRPSVREPKFITNKGRDSALHDGRGGVEVVARIESSVADKLENASMNLIRPRLRDHVGEAGGAVPGV